MIGMPRLSHAKCRGRRYRSTRRAAEAAGRSSSSCRRTASPGCRRDDGAARRRRSVGRSACARAAAAASSSPGARAGHARRPNSCLAHSAAAAASGRAASRQALFGGEHGAFPDLGRQGAAGDAAGGRVVVIAHPHARHIVGGEAHEPGVLGILRGAGLARGLARRAARRCAPVPAVITFHSIATRSRSTLSAMMRCGCGGVRAVEQLAVRVVHFGDEIGIDAIAAIGEGGIGARSIPAASLRWCPAPAKHWLPAAR